MKQFFSLIALSSAAMLHAQTFNSWTMADGLPSDDIRDVAVASDGTIWLATSQGVAAFDGTSFTVHNTTTHPGLASNDVMAIEVLSNGQVWVGTDFGLSVNNGSSYTTYTVANGLGSDQVRNIKQAGPGGEIWVATISGVARFNGGGFTAYGAPDIPFGGALHTAFASNGDVLISGGLGGVIVYNGFVFSAITTANGLLNNRIRSIAVDAAQNKWVGTAEGISVLDASNAHTVDHPHVYIMPPPDELNPVTDMLVDDHGRIWAGIYVDYLVTVGGVSAYNGSTWTQYDESDGLAGPNVRRLAMDDDGDIWVCTSTGLTEISDITIGITEAKQTSFALFPNPVSNQMEIVLGELPSVPATVELRDAMGRLVLTERISWSRSRVDVSVLDPGLYHARLGQRVQAFVIAR